MPLFGNKNSDKHADVPQQQPLSGGRDRLPGRTYRQGGGDQLPYDQTQQPQYGGQDFQGQPQGGQGGYGGGMQGFDDQNQGFANSGAQNQGYGASGAQPTTVTSGQGHTGLGSGTGTGTGAGRTGGGGGMQGFQGRVEQGVGTVVGSESLKQKGLQREQEAKALRSQGEDVAQAERLEREAHQIRQKAGHGHHGLGGNTGNQGYQGRTGGF